MLLTKENAEKEADKIGKIEYQPNVTFTSAEIDKLDDTEYSNKTRTPFYDLRRCAVNVSPDGKKMLMFKQSRQGNVQYSFYDFNAIKKALDSNSTNDRSFRYNDKSPWVLRNVNFIIGEIWIMEESVFSSLLRRRYSQNFFHTK